MVDLVRVPCTHNTADVIATLERDGCIVIEDILQPGCLSALREEVFPLFSATPPCHGDFYGHSTKRISSLIAKSSACQHMAIHPLVIQVMDAFLLKSCHQYQLNLTQGIQIGPGEPQQIIHRDDLMFPCSHPGKEWMINCMWAVDEFTIENGATHVVPGSHLWDPARQPDPHEILQAAMKPGSLLIYLASLLHGGGANRTNRPRTGLVLSYILGWLRQAENQYLATPPSIAAGLPEPLQRLLGYFVHEPNLGSVERQDPIVLLQGKDTSNAPFEEFLSENDRRLLREYREGVRVAA